MLAVILKWTVVLLSTLNAGYMSFDGLRALILGDYIRPRHGQYAGKLGPWAELVRQIGIDPESTLMKLIFVAWGLAGLSFTFFFALDAAWAWNAMIIFAICSSWYLYMGTGSSIIQILLLIIIRLIR